MKEREGKFEGRAELEVSVLFTFAGLTGQLKSCLGLVAVVEIVVAVVGLELLLFLFWNSFNNSHPPCFNNSSPLNDYIQLPWDLHK